MTSAHTHEMFSVPFWTAQVDPSTWWMIPRLADDITEMLETDLIGYDRSSGNQTLAVLQDRTEEHWRAFLDWMGGVFEEIVATAPVQRYPRYDIRAWALRVDPQSAAKDRAAGPERVLATHNHTPALVTSVFTCELPEEPPAADLATIFHNPIFHVNCPWQPKLHPVAPAVGKVVVFPGWVEHSVPITAPIPPGQRRITINTDYFPAFG